MHFAQNSGEINPPTSCLCDRSYLNLATRSSLLLCLQLVLLSNSHSRAPTKTALGGTADIWWDASQTLKPMMSVGVTLTDFTIQTTCQVITKSPDQAFLYRVSSRLTHMSLACSGYYSHEPDAQYPWLTNQH